ncbi:MAG TPA: hypothetical protein VLD39_04400, partial [Gammaproteobacteria bacterium]|nr:hypothetical protein [Gammaproteobacteria bacterium]
MRTKAIVTLALLVCVAQGAAAQDVRSVLQAVAQNIGADRLTTLEISGAGGFGAAPGASHSPNDDWPRFELKSYRLQIDFDTGYLREQMTRAQGSYPVLGGNQGVSPDRDHTLDVALNGDWAWTIAGGGAGPLDREGYMDGIPVPELRKLQILLTPHGFVKAALARGANPSLVRSVARGSPVHYVSIRALDKYTVTAALNAENEVMHVQTRVANPMFGDMLYETRYGDYAQFGTLKYPQYVHHHQGDERLNRGHNALEVRVSAARANGPIEVLTPPDSARRPP